MTKRKVIAFTSDTHYFHEKSIEFDKRPFRDLEHMHRVLINNYNAQIPPDGVCYFLGDVGMGNKQELKKVISQLNGVKILVSGNHDGGANAMYDIGFDVVLNSATLYIAGERVTLSHCPLRGVFREDTTGMRNSDGTENWHGEKRHLQYSVQDEGQFHLSGHIHSSPHNGKKRTDGRQMDVGVVNNEYRPVNISAIESWISRVKNGTWVDK